MGCSESVDLVRERRDHSSLLCLNGRMGSKGFDLVTKQGEGLILFDLDRRMWGSKRVYGLDERFDCLSLLDDGCVESAILNSKLVVATQPPFMAIDSSLHLA